jgi:hypothetical protein
MEAPRDGPRRLSIAWLSRRAPAAASGTTTAMTSPRLIILPIIVVSPSSPEFGAPGVPRMPARHTR